MVDGASRLAWVTGARGARFYSVVQNARGTAIVAHGGTVRRARSVAGTALTVACSRLTFTGMASIWRWDRSETKTCKYLIF